MNARRLCIGLVAWAAGVLAVVADAPLARADTPPSAWDVARDPAERDRWNLHVSVQRMLAAGDEGTSGKWPLLERAMVKLEAADAASSPDVRLRFDLGMIYEALATLERRIDLHEKAAAVLESALNLSPDDPAATGALESLAYAYTNLDRPRDELAAWRRYIPRLFDDTARASPMMNMGEVEMRLGYLDEARSTFQMALELCESLPNTSRTNSIYALTLWDLALVLDRSGDPAAALETAAKAKGWMWNEAIGPQTMRMVTGWDEIQDDVTVFFVPAWERDWYLALGYASSARHASDPRDAARLWGEAEAHWQTYVTRSAASGGRDPFLPVARSRYERARSEHVEAQKRAAKLPPRAKGPGDAWVDD